MPSHQTLIEQLKAILSLQQDLELAILIGSRAQQSANQNSDWDIAIRWKKHISAINALSLTSTLQIAIAQCLNVPPEAIDLIDMTTARLAMRATIVEEGIPLAGEDSLAWSYFLTQTWAELEEHYWRAQHAA
ncbi:type VII toxin-antitoxin system MntA family adenylyltransferase antitoxin [Methylophilus aquaticus]|uniref:Nucleotidyltransferase domain-containing protein n=1 Tax=Methylophilus aquaticus TaxID=1971610 RepID=A0ABT9JU04_9PROT|nr:nucleotidyltransferase domain-containing protein [Methylophilus aquaticus]MDP8568068.1 nucleotidyltransferase domain-containing protein [Methylophilus aquaticus]